ncbi:hypothetical protein GUJ93_ZPchr0036g6511 [Zizania palustris]|uniref:Myb-like domain-containing protein n=1 Tax=Zizania palustris TaxID=103762 RepID=A0A8J5R2R8_ZIZPA|nr:hypothetical protein GUJ93_ZPchr0036g6511 [Zizania palustris]
MAGGDSPSSADGAPPSPAPQMIEQRRVLVRIHEVRSESNGEPYIDIDGSSDTLPNVVEPRLKKGPWTQAEDAILEAYVKRHGGRNWKAVQKNTGLLSCGFSNGHFSASRSTIGPSKMEPPSIQVAAETPVAGFNELIAPQYEHGDVSSHSDDFWSSAALFLNGFINLPDFQQDEFDMFMNTDMDTEAKPVSSGTGITTLPK